MSTMPGLKSKIEHAGLEEKVADMIFKDKLAYADIVDILKKEHNIEVSEASISNFKKMVMETVPNFLEHNEAYREQLAKHFLDAVELLIFSLEHIKEKIDQFKEPKKWRQQTAYLTLALQEAHMLLKRSGEIKPTQIIEHQEINMIQINMAVQNEIMRMIDSKEINLESCSNAIKDMYRKMKVHENFA